MRCLVTSGPRACETGGIDEQLIDIRVVPRARRNEVGGERAGRLLVRTTAAPVDGSANAAVLALLAEHLDVRVSALSIVRGTTNRDKTVRVERVGPR